MPLLTLNIEVKSGDLVAIGCMAGATTLSIHTYYSGGKAVRGSLNGWLCKQTRSIFLNVPWDFFHQTHNVLQVNLDLHRTCNSLKSRKQKSSVAAVLIVLFDMLLVVDITNYSTRLIGI